MNRNNTYQHKPTGGFARRHFLVRMAMLGGGAVAGGNAFNLLVAAQPARQAGSEPGAASSGGRGQTRMVRGEIKEYKDSRTGARVRRLTGDGSSNVHPYFTSWAFVGDGTDRTVFVSNRSGSHQWYLLEIKEARLVQLTAAQAASPNMACVARDGRVFYFDGPALHEVRVDTLSDRELYQVPTGYKPALPTCTADGRYVAFAYREQTALSTETGRIYATMHEQFFQHPRSVIMRVDTKDGTVAAAWGETAWISHVLIHPTQPNLILFCHEGGSTCVQQRMWTVDLDDKIARQAKPLYPQRPGEACVHEFFTQQGDVGFQHTLIQGDRREEFNAFIRPDGTWIRQYLYPGRRPGHMQSNSPNTLCVGDAAYLGPEDKEGGKYIGLMTHVNGRVEVRRLCWHGSSGRTQASHGHPSFSPDDRWVVFNSDAEKADNVYMSEVES